MRSEPERRLVLASASPRRHELLAKLGVPFEVVPSEIEEEPLLPGEEPGAYAERLALDKALAVRQPDRLTIGADTVVWLEGEALGKPQNGEEARQMLKRLRGREHLVITGLAMVNDVRQTCHVTTTVLMRNYSNAEIEAYVANGDPLDKAGAYAIQNAAFHPVENIDGCYQNVVGLPLCALARLLRKTGLDVPRVPEGELPEECCRCDERKVLTRQSSTPRICS